MNFKKILAASLLCIGLLYVVHIVQGATIYFAQTAAGSATGANCANAIALSSVTWTSGNSYHICGTITSQVSVGASNVTIIFETGAMISMPACGTTGCINISGRTGIVIDGSPTSTPCGFVNHVDVACNGIIQATNNGSALSKAESYGVYARSGGTNEIRNLNIINMYINVPADDDSTTGTYNLYAVWMDGAGNSVHNNVMHDDFAGVKVEGGSSGDSFYDNQIYNCNWGIAEIGANSVNSITNEKIYDNDIHDFAIWDTPSDFNHHDGVFISGNSATTDVSHIDIYRNYLHGTTSDPSVCTSSVSCMTAYFYVNTDNHVRLFNNLAIMNSGDPGPSNGPYLMFISDSDALYNNTTFGGGVNGNNSNCYVIEALTNFTFENNIGSNCPVLVWVQGTVTFTAIDYNVYQTPSALGIFWRNQGSYYTTMSTWASAISGESHSHAQNTTLNLNGSYVPQSGSLAILNAKNLTSLSIPTLDIDYASVARSATLAWDAGALQSGSPSPPPPGSIKIINSSLVPGVVGTPYDVPFQSTGGTPPVTWSVSPLVPGLSQLAGSLTGTPSMPGTTALTIAVVDSSTPMESDSATLSLVITSAATRPIPLIVIPTTLTSSWTAGATAPAVQSFTVDDNGPFLPLTISTDSTWLKATPVATTTATSPVKISVSVATTGLVTGVYNGNIIVTCGALAGISCPNSPLKVPYILTVSGAAPVLTLATPLCAVTIPGVDGCTITSTGAKSISVSVTATGSNGQTITKTVVIPKP